MNIKKEAKMLENEKIIILIPYWRIPRPEEYAFNLIKKNIPKDFGYLYYSFSGDILNKDIFLTRKYFNQFILKIYNDLNNLKKEKKRKFYIYSQSLGCLFAMIIADKIKIDKVVLINPGDNLAESFWNGSVTQTIKKEMENNGINLLKLKNIWKKISPDFYFKNKSKKTKFYIKLSRNDKLIPYKNGRNLIRLLKEKKINFIFYETFLPHKLSLFYECIFPNKMLNFLTNE